MTRSTIVRILAPIALLALSQATRFENTLVVRYDGSTVAVDTQGTTIATNTAAGRIDEIRARLQASSSGRVGVAGLSITDARGRTILEESSPVLTLFGIDVLGTLRRGPVEVPRTFGDWSHDRAVGEPVVLFAAPLPDRFELTVRFVGRGLKRIDLVGAETVSVALHDGFLDAVTHVCVAADCPASYGGAEPFWTNLRRIVGFFVEAAFGAALLVALWPGLRRRAPPPPEPSGHVVAGVVAGAAAVHLALAVWLGSILGFIPHVPDSAVYYRIAILLAHGLRVVPGVDAESAPALLSNASHWDDGAIVHEFGPFWPAILAPGIVAGIPHLVNPILSLAGVLLVHAVGRRMVGARAALVGTVLYAMSPLVVVQAADYMTHTATLVCLLGAALCGSSAAERESRLEGALAGVLAGWAFAIRPLTALAVLPALALFVVRGAPLRSPRVATAAALGTAAVFGLWMLDNALVTGDPLAPPIAAFLGTSVGPENFAAGAGIVDSNLGHLPPILTPFPWPPLFLVLPALGLLAGRRGAAIALLPFASLLVAHLFVSVPGLHGYGPRFLFEGAFGVFLAAGAGIVSLWQASGRWLRRGLAVAALALLASGIHTHLEVLPRYRHYNGIDSSLFEKIRALDLEHSIVVAHDPGWQALDIAATLFDPRFERSIFVRALPGGDHRTVLERHPHRTVHHLRGRTLSRGRPASER